MKTCFYISIFIDVRGVCEEFCLETIEYVVNHLSIYLTIILFYINRFPQFNDDEVITFVHGIGILTYISQSNQV